MNYEEKYQDNSIEANELIFCIVDDDFTSNGRALIVTPKEYFEIEGCIYDDYVEGMEEIMEDLGLYSLQEGVYEFSDDRNETSLIKCLEEVGMTYSQELEAYMNM